MQNNIYNKLFNTDGKLFKNKSQPKYKTLQCIINYFYISIVFSCIIMVYNRSLANSKYLFS